MRERRRAANAAGRSRASGYSVGRDRSRAPRTALHATKTCGILGWRMSRKNVELVRRAAEHFPAHRRALVGDARPGDRDRRPRHPGREGISRGRRLPRVGCPLGRRVGKPWSQPPGIRAVRGSTVPWARRRSAAARAPLTPARSSPKARPSTVGLVGRFGTATLAPARPRSTRGVSELRNTRREALVRRHPAALG